MKDFLIVAVAYAGYFAGHYTREIKDLLITIKNRVGELKVAQDKDQAPQTTFAEPMTRTEMAALLEEEKIALLNK